MHTELEASLLPIIHGTPPKNKREEGTGKMAQMAEKALRMAKHDDLS